MNKNISKFFTSNISRLSFFILIFVRYNSNLPSKEGRPIFNYR